MGALETVGRIENTHPALRIAGLAVQVHSVIEEAIVADAGGVVGEAVLEQQTILELSDIPQYSVQSWLALRAVCNLTLLAGQTESMTDYMKV